MHGAFKATDVIKYQIWTKILVNIWIVDCSVPQHNQGESGWGKLKAALTSPSVTPLWCPRARPPDQSCRWRRQHLTYETRIYILMTSKLGHCDYNFGELKHQSTTCSIKEEGFSDSNSTRVSNTKPKLNFCSWGCSWILILCSKGK